MTTKLTNELLTILLPNPDHCSQCRRETGSRFPLYAAEMWHEGSFEEDQSDGLTAYYKCLKGHSWQTYWGTGTMISGDTLAQLIAFDSVIPPSDYRKPA